MNENLQAFLALVVVAIAAGLLIRRALVKRKSPGCGEDCGCGTKKKL